MEQFLLNCALLFYFSHTCSSEYDSANRFTVTNDMFVFFFLFSRIDFRYLAAPNLAKSEVLKMLEEEEGSKVPGEPPKQTVVPRRRLPGNVEWPPKYDIKQSPSFFTRCGSQGNR